MSDKSESNNDKSRNCSVVYVYSPEYIQTCDSLSKVPNRVRWAALLTLPNTTHTSVLGQIDASYFTALYIET